MEEGSLLAVPFDSPDAYIISSLVSFDNQTVTIRDSFPSTSGNTLSEWVVGWSAAVPIIQRSSFQFQSANKNSDSQSTSISHSNNHHFKYNDKVLALWNGAWDSLNPLISFVEQYNPSEWSTVYYKGKIERSYRATGTVDANIESFWIKFKGEKRSFNVPTEVLINNRRTPGILLLKPMTTDEVSETLELKEKGKRKEPIIDVNLQDLQVKNIIKSEKEKDNDIQIPIPQLQPCINTNINETLCESEFKYDIVLPDPDNYLMNNQKDSNSTKMLSLLSLDKNQKKENNNNIDNEEYISHLHVTAKWNKPQVLGDNLNNIIVAPFCI